jgi:hypothetical protein
MKVPRCPAKSKTTGNQCGHPAGWGTDHNSYGLCRIHGGASPGGRKQAQALIAAASAQAFGLPIETSPEDALSQELARTAGTVAYLGTYLQAVAPEQRLTGETAAFAKLYGEERRHLTLVAKTCLDAGIAERHVAAIERTASAFSEVLRRVLSDLDVLDDPRAPVVVQRHLALLNPGGPDA